MKWVFPFVLIGSAGALTVWYGGIGKSAVKGAVPPSQDLPGPASVLDGRSPGERDPGALFQTKPVANMAIPEEPNAPETNLLEPSPLPGIEDMPRAFTAIAPPPDDAAPGIDTGQAPVGAAIGSGASPGSIIAPFQQIPQPFFGPPVLQQVGSIPPVTDIPVGSIPAAPEPASWATMLIGFLGLGGLLRRARRKPGRDVPA